MKHFDWSIEGDAGRNIEHKTVGEKRAVERHEWPSGVQQWCFEPRTYQGRPFNDCFRRRPQPCPRGQPLSRAKLWRKASVEKREAICRFREPDLGKLSARRRVNDSPLGMDRQ